jgi:hypothetical protein
MQVLRGRGDIAATHFFTSALNGGEWSVSHPSCALPPGKGPPVPIGQEAGWASEPVWTQRPEGKSFASAGDRAPVIQSVVRPQILLNYESRKILLIIFMVQFTNV